MLCKLQPRTRNQCRNACRGGAAQLERVFRRTECKRWHACSLQICPPQVNSTFLSLSVFYPAPFLMQGWRWLPIVSTALPAYVFYATPGMSATRETTLLSTGMYSAAISSNLWIAALDIVLKVISEACH